MTAQTRTVIKTHFNTGDTPSEAHFIDTLDSTFFAEDFVGDNLLMTAAERSKLSGVATGATANAGALADKNTVATADIDDDAVTIAKLAATGTASSSTFLRGDNTWAGAVITTLTDGASIATDGATSEAFTVTLAGNRTLANPTNVVAGKTYIWRIIQDATGGRTLGYGTNFKWASGAIPTLSTAANATDIIVAFAWTSTFLTANIQKDFS